MHKRNPAATQHRFVRASTHFMIVTTSKGGDPRCSFYGEIGKWVPARNSFNRIVEGAARSSGFEDELQAIRIWVEGLRGCLPFYGEPQDGSLDTASARRVRSRRGELPVRRRSTRVQLPPTICIRSQGRGANQVHEVNDGIALQWLVRTPLDAGAGWGGAGRVNVNRHIATANDTPLANSLLSVMQVMGVQRTAFGDSSGTIPGLAI